MDGRALCVVMMAGLAGCAHPVPQASHTGADGKITGARPISLENSEGKAHGIVTYPGGDRVDWKVVEVPAGKRGALDFKLQWVPPRPGLQLAFDVFDQWNAPVKLTLASAHPPRRGRTREGILEEAAAGKYFIRVYAVGRGDAGTYQMTVAFQEAPPPPPPLPPLAIPDPPHLADLPPEPAPAPVACTDATFDVKNPGCTDFCPKFGAPLGWPACGDVCPIPQNADIPACQKVMKCPPVRDERIADCRGKFPPCPDKRNPDLSNPNCRVPPEPVVGRIVKNSVVGDSIEILIAVGTDQGVGATGWTAHVVRGETGESPLAGGDVTIVHVGKVTTTARVRLTPDVLQQNPRVKLSPPR